MNHPATTKQQARHVEKLVSWTCRERLRFLWYRLRLTVSEMNYAGPADDRTANALAMNRLQSALLHTAPAVIIAAYGALWIALHAGAGRSTAHTLWQSPASPKP